ncbi:MAG: hypothetical protein LHW58_00170, partial [Candidatus Cloacimonetes bacterium]|nr:hypothetical protein [Candidatus Cloacimonadota bacterium]MCK9178593.1 hypothetical protein [Candidatus Cloacimonadota bacterium]
MIKIRKKFGFGENGGMPVRFSWHSPKISSHSFDNELNDSILAIIYAYVFQFILLAVKIHDS